MQSGRFHVLFLLFGNTAAPTLSIDPGLYLPSNMMVGKTMTCNSSSTSLPQVLEAS